MSTPSKEFRILKKATRKVISLDEPGEAAIIALAIKMKMNPADIRKWGYTDVDKVLLTLEKQAKKKNFGQAIEEAIED